MNIGRQFEQYFSDEKFKFYWDSYRCALDNAQNANAPFKFYMKNLTQMKNAAYQAHMATCNQLAKEGMSFNCFETNRAGENTSLTHSDQIRREDKLEKKTKVTKSQKSKAKPKSDFEFEINNEFLEFYRESIRFKSEAELKKKDKINRKDTDLQKDLNFSSLDLKVQEREPEIRSLYGKHSDRILQMEAELQINYDHNIDLYEPKYWPSFPLKVKF